MINPVLLIILVLGFINFIFICSDIKGFNSNLHHFDSKMFIK